VTGVPECGCTGTSQEPTELAHRPKPSGRGVGGNWTLRSWPPVGSGNPIQVGVHADRAAFVETYPRALCPHELPYSVREIRRELSGPRSGWDAHSTSRVTPRCRWGQPSPAGEFDWVEPRERSSLRIWVEPNEGDNGQDDEALFAKELGWRTAVHDGFVLSATVLAYRFTCFRIAESSSLRFLDE
jgi:hypothetical protein